MVSDEFVGHRKNYHQLSPVTGDNWWQLVTSTHRLKKSKDDVLVRFWGCGRPESDVLIRFLGGGQSKDGVWWVCRPPQKLSPVVASNWWQLVTTGDSQKNGKKCWVGFWKIRFNWIIRCLVRVESFISSARVVFEIHDPPCTDILWICTIWAGLAGLARSQKWWHFAISSTYSNFFSRRSYINPLKTGINFIGLPEISIFAVPPEQF